MKNFKPKMNYVLIKIIEKDVPKEKKTKTGIILPESMDPSLSQSNDVTPARHNFIIEAIGPDVKNLEVGEHVIFNEYDMKWIQDSDEKVFGICKEESIVASYED